MKRSTMVIAGTAVAAAVAGVAGVAAASGGSEDAVYTAFFPTTTIDIEYLDRNPAPGTEGDPPQPPVVYSARA